MWGVKHKTYIASRSFSILIVRCSASLAYELFINTYCVGQSYYCIDFMTLMIEFNIFV